MASQTRDQNLFIYNRKEVFTLTLLSITTALFTFTLGVHFGKKITSAGYNSNFGPEILIPATTDSLPNRQELSEQGSVASQVLNDSLFDSLRREVKKKSLRIDKPHQVNLPKKAISKNAGATTLQHKTISDKTSQDKTTSATHMKYTVQVGSYPSLEEAQRKMSELGELKYPVFIEKMDLKNKMKVFRIHIGNFSTRQAAEEAGKALKIKQKIPSFLVLKKK